MQNPPTLNLDNGNIMNPILTDVALALLHHLFVFSLVAVLFAEYVIAGDPSDAARVRLLGRLDSGYGALAVGILVVGFARAAIGAKGWDFYAGNPVFWGKIAVFAVIGLLSAVPTVRFIRWRKQGVVPSAAALRNTRGWILVQLVLLPALPLLAILMARGVGL